MSTRINVMFPNDLLEQIREKVPERKRSEFIVNATREYLVRETQRQAFEAAAGSWNDPSQAYLDTDEGMQSYLDETRKGWEERLKWLDDQR